MLSSLCQLPCVLHTEGKCIAVEEQAIGGPSEALDLSNVPLPAEAADAIKSAAQGSRPLGFLLTANYTIALPLNNSPVTFAPVAIFLNT